MAPGFAPIRRPSASKYQTVPVGGSEAKAVLRNSAVTWRLIEAMIVSWSELRLSPGKCQDADERDNAESDDADGQHDLDERETPRADPRRKARRSKPIAVRLEIHGKVHVTHFFRGVRS